MAFLLQFARVYFTTVCDIIWHMRKLILSSSIAMCLLISITGCGTSAPATISHPGAINAFDSNVFDALVTIQAGLDEARAQAPMASPAFRTLLNQAIAAYNTAMNSYKVYHTTASADPAAQAALQMQIDALKVNLANLKVAK